MSSWQGTYHIEKRLVRDKNRLADIIVFFGTDRGVDLSRASAWLKEAIETLEWFKAQKAPRSEKFWQETELRMLEGKIQRASAKMGLR